jgi:hypothetical protein
MTPTPMVPRITKSTAVAAIRARFENEGELLERFEVAKEQANLWDGERDGLREAVKAIPSGSFVSTSGNTVVLSRTETAKVLYPNASGKHQLENCLQTTIPTGLIGGPVCALAIDCTTPEELLGIILYQLRGGGGEQVLQFLKDAWLGSGAIVDNAGLYEKKGSEKSSITVIPHA